MNMGVKLGKCIAGWVLLTEYVISLATDMMMTEYQFHLRRYFHGLWELEG